MEAKPKPLGKEQPISKPVDLVVDPESVPIIYTPSAEGVATEAGD